MKALANLFRIMADRQWRWLIAGIFAGILVLAANVALMAVSGWFIASMAVAGITKASFNYVIPAVAIRTLAIIRTLGRYVERLVTHEAAFRMLADLRTWLFERLIPLAPAGLEGYASGDLTGRLRADVDNMESLYLRIIAPLVTGCSVILLAPLCLSLWSPAAGSALFIALFAAGVLLPLVTRYMAAQPGEQAVRLAGELRKVVTEGLQGAEELLLLGASTEQAGKVDALYAEIARQQRQLGGISGVAIGGVTAAGGLALAVLLMIAAAEVSRGAISGPELVMLLLFSAASFEGIAPLAAALQTLPATYATARRLTELAAAPHPLPEPAATLPVVSAYDIVFRGVCFAYNDGADVLKDFSMTIPEGDRVALTGRSGIGKSSLVELLLRFRPYRGSISIGGTELRDLASQQISTLISAVPQRPHLFNSSIRANILLGAPDADNRQICEVLEDSGLSAWVESLPDGLDTVVGVAGSAVSGGEARRIALARALLHDTPIILLDEPTEGLDPDIERTVVARLLKRLHGKTVLLITHRTACLALANRIIRKTGFLALAVIACLCLPHFAGAASQVKLRINTSHGLSNAKGAVVDAGLSTSKVLVTPSSTDDGKSFLSPDKFVEDARSVGATILSSSFSGWDYLFDSTGYQQLTINGMLHVYAYVPRKPQPPGAPPPAAFATVNMIGGASGGGIEFGVPTDYMHGKGQSPWPSGVTAQVAGLLACLKYQHPTWNWFDVKAALRATAANYPTGYDPLKYGYGAINYQDANAFTNATQLALFAPAAVILGQQGDRLFFRINPFKQTRRFTDVVFKFRARPTQTLKEMTLAEITAMGGEYLFSSYLHLEADNYSYRMTRGETAYLVWFTQDSARKFSRIEPYSIFGPINFSSFRSPAAPPTTPPYASP